MKCIFTTTMIFLTLHLMGQQSELAIIPQPLSIDVNDGYYSLSEYSTIAIQSDIDLSFEVANLNKQIKRAIGTNLKLVKDGTETENQIVLKCTQGNGDSEDYSLSIDDKQIIISATDRTGLFYGIQTLSQIVDNAGDGHKTVRIPCVIIDDKPRFKYRALMLDPARHFLPVDDVKKYIDVMAMYKFNHLHLHLSDDQGWRVEIEKYPLLNTISSFRRETDGDGKPHYGYYTKAELKELVAYANQRFITIVPELDVPGHSVAALSAYPEYTCFPKMLKVRTIPGVSKDLFCAGNDSTFLFLRDLISEMVEVFPSERFHLGGDEAPLDHWKECSKCQSKIKEKGLGDEHGLMSYFFDEVNQILIDYNKRPLFWYELDVPKYPKGSTMYAWRGGLTSQVISKTRHEGFSLICSPGEHAYFDYPQAKGEETCDWMAYLPLRQVYKFDPGYGLSPNKQAHIIGVEATLWGEYVKNIDRAFYMTWPRAFALVEAGWSEMENRSWESFQKRLYPQLERLQKLNVKYRNPTELGKPFNR
ncbi:beta-N-acetylhexosaminidase [Carboxylicivirga sediminis]|uniref:beta-N-acetylhexosaminidase n=1 Tax=Carboxylicivirga sediminis TaxID=2006564 RepID=A0A941F3S6_9BACT|nr:beta-N-acetylhexosaminidase [Carboxylicivirga sediminis]MBR8535854.1 beta-N-acetylhexosaminidase [Carboxylicivirga sediminis]